MGVVHDPPEPVRAPSKLPHVPRSRMYEASMCVLLIWRETHTPATVREVAKRMGYRSTSGPIPSLNAAVHAGLIEQHADRSYWPKETCVCPNCGASHVSEQSA